MQQRNLHITGDNGSAVWVCLNDIAYVLVPAEADPSGLLYLRGGTQLVLPRPVCVAILTQLLADSQHQYVA